MYRWLLNAAPHYRNVQGTYSWALLREAIWRVFPKEIWYALNNESMLNDTMNHDEWKEDDSIYNMKQSADPGGLWSAFAMTYLLTVEPNDLDRFLDADAEEQAAIQVTISHIIWEIRSLIRRKHEIFRAVQFMSSQDDHHSSNTLHCRLIYFKNSVTAQKVISEIIEPLKKKYGDFHIELVSLRKSNPTAYKQCGYIPMNESQALEVNGTDDISEMIRNELKSMAQCKIKLLLLMGCYSHHLAMVFQPFVEHIICIHPHCEIEDEYTIKFSHYLYEKLAEYKKKGTFKNVPRAFDEALQRLTADIDMVEGELPECMQVHIDCVSIQCVYALSTYAFSECVDSIQRVSVDSFSIIT